jgi:ankyrin repeat protein
MLLELCSNRNAQEKKDLFRKLATDKDVNVNCRNNIGRTPLMLLCSKNFIDFDILASILLKPYDNFSHSRVDLKLKDREGSNALHLLLDSNHNFIDETLITNLLCHPSSLDLNDRNKDGMNTLHLLCASPYKDQNLSKLIQLFIDKGLKINKTDKNGFSALDHIL